MAIEDRDYLHEDRKAKIRRGQMADIYYNPKEFRGDRVHVHGSVTLPPGQGAAHRPEGRGPTDYRRYHLPHTPNGHPSRLLWFTLGIVSGFLATLAVLVMERDLLRVPYLYMLRFLQPFIS